MRKPSAIVIVSILLLVTGIGPLPAPRAAAMDPITIAVLAPIAVEAAKVMTPYVMRGLRCGALHMVKMGHDVINIFRLPLGFLQGTIGAPLGMFGDGVQNCCTGGIAPFKLAWDALLLPVALVGIETGI